MLSKIGRGYQKLLKEKLLILYCPLEVREWSSATARVTAALTVVHARRLVGFAAHTATGTASAARITRIDCDCDWVIYWVVKLYLVIMIMLYFHYILSLTICIQ
jgi:hypothetical protein